MSLDLLFNPGMYVRMPSPNEIDREDGEYRDFHIGQIVCIDNIARTADVAVQTIAPDQAPQMETVECSINKMERCHMLPNTPFIHKLTEQRGMILVACDDTIPEGTLCRYYVHLGDQTKKLDESEMIVSSFRQDPSPYQQLYRYEFHSPIWKFHRDQLIEDYNALHNASFGIEDLVGSRVMLLPHQAEVITKVLSSVECRYMLADEVGLGKTIEACVILKSLRRRNSKTKTLIVAPSSLVQQWYNELNNKFWLDFVIARPGTSVHFPAESPGVIISAEDLANYDVYWNWFSIKHWDLLIVDEAHHIKQNTSLYQRVQHLSRNIPHVLILTATPIQRHATEYLSLLKLLDPSRYDSLSSEAFDRILAAQGKIRQVIVYLKPNLTDDFFDAEEFQEEFEILMDDLGHDSVLVNLIEQVTHYAKRDEQDKSLASAKAVIAYISENYRIESRIIRNRRASLDIALPKRKLDDSFRYAPEEAEVTALDELYSYIDFFLEQTPPEPPQLEYCRILLHAAASTPHALLALLEVRDKQLTITARSSVSSSAQQNTLHNLALPSDYRQEKQRITQLIQALPVLDEEKELLRHVLWYTKQWCDQTDHILTTISLQELSTLISSQHRLLQVLLLIQQSIEQDESTKIVIFTRWQETLSVLNRLLQRFYSSSTVAQFNATMSRDALQQAVDQFQADDTCRILICDELGGEGRNFQIADTIIHLDLPWTPAQIEQRIGRVDRLGRTGTVWSFVPFAEETLEHDLFRIWHDAFHLFTRSMSGMEIALEGIQNELAQALVQSTRHGLEGLLPDMVQRYDHLHKEVEEERYFEEGAINHRFRQQFQTMSEHYRDGSRLRNVFLPWATLAGLKYNYHPHKDTVQFYPKGFNLKSMANAKFLPPNMEEALRRSRNANQPFITGTFNRDKAVQREDLVFFAPGDDPWTDAVIANAMEADRGRCCAILRMVLGLEQTWRGFELLYRLQIDPRPLYAAGYDTAHLFRAQGFLAATTYRLLLSIDGQPVKKSHMAWEHVKEGYKKGSDFHLGKRDNPKAFLQMFKQLYPPDMWHAIIAPILQIEKCAFKSERADEAKHEFAQQAESWRASLQWFMRTTGMDTSTDAIAEYERISAALVEGIRCPIIKLESVCFWILQGKTDDETE